MWQTIVHGPCETQYPFIVGSGLLRELGSRLQQIMAAGQPIGRVAVVTNATLCPLYEDQLLRGLQAAGFDGFVVEILDGERYKTLKTVAAIYERLLDEQLDRSGLVIALGGGVVGDTAGFAAASFLRGIRFVQAPTSLLAMVDASIGGKVGVDLPRGKNLIGAFHQPALVLADTDSLATLPRAEWVAGMAEVVKAGLIGDPELLALLEARVADGEAVDWGEAMVEIIARAAAVKIAIVEADPLESGRRAVLNLGHTFAHALETRAKYQMRHGEAVAIGLVAAARLSASLGYCSPALVTRVEQLLSRLGLPTSVAGPEFDPDAVLAAMSTDKKRAGGQIRFVLLREAGDVFVSRDVPLSAISFQLSAISRSQG